MSLKDDFAAIDATEKPWSHLGVFGLIAFVITFFAVSQGDCSDRSKLPKKVKKTSS